MPGFDGTGPAGMGAATGGGRGYCRPGTAFGNAGFGRGGRGRCFGRGYGRGYGGGFQRGGRFFQGDAGAVIPPAPAMSREEELAMLKAEAESAKNSLNSIQQRINALETEKQE